MIAKLKKKPIIKSIILIIVIMLSISGIVYSTGFNLEQSEELQDVTSVDFIKKGTESERLTPVGSPSNWTNVEIDITQDKQYKIEDNTSVGISIAGNNIERLVVNTLKKLNNKTKQSGMKQLDENPFLFCTSHELKLPSYRSYDNPDDLGRGIELNHTWGTTNMLQSLGMKDSYTNRGNENTDSRWENSIDDMRDSDVPSNADFDSKIGNVSQSDINDAYAKGEIDEDTWKQASQGLIDGAISILRPDWGHGTSYRPADLQGDFLNLAYMTDNTSDNNTKERFY